MRSYKAMRRDTVYGSGEIHTYNRKIILKTHTQKAKKYEKDNNIRPCTGCLPDDAVCGLCANTDTAVYG